MLLPLIFLFTFTLWLTPTPAADEWVLHKTITKPGDNVTSIAFSPTGSRLVVGTRYNSTAYNVQVYNGNTFEYIHGKDYTDSGQRDEVYAVAYRQGWYEAAIGGRFRKIYFYNTLRNSTLYTLSMPIEIRDLAYRPDGKRLAACGYNNDVYIVYTDHQNGTRRLLRTLRAHTDSVYAIAWNPDGSILASSGQDGTVRLWNPERGVNYAVLRGHTEEVYSVAFSPDGRTLVSASADGTTRLWDVSTRRHIRTINDTPSGTLAFHPSKQILAFHPAGARHIRLYNLATMQQIQTLGEATSSFASHQAVKISTSARMARSVFVLNAPRADFR